MKKITIMASLIFLSLSSKTTAFDVTNYLNSNILHNYTAVKTNMDSGCQFRNFFNNNCIVFWTQYNEYQVLRGGVFNQQNGTNYGNISIPINCNIKRHKLDASTNPNSTQGIKTGDETYSANYNINFVWYTNGNPFDNRINFYIHNNVTFEFISGNRDNELLANEYCTKAFIDSIKLLNGNTILLK